MQALKRHAANAYAQATAHNTDTDPATQIGLLVQSLQWDPENTEVRALLEQKIESRGVPDLTRHCSVYRDAARAEAISREAIRRCMDYVSIAGVAGEIMDFGVLAGWSARIFAETARDLMYLCELHLFDSFEGSACGVFRYRPDFL